MRTCTQGTFIIGSRSDCQQVLLDCCIHVTFVEKSHSQVAMSAGIPWVSVEDVLVDTDCPIHITRIIQNLRQCQLRVCITRLNGESASTMRNSTAQISTTVHPLCE